MSTRISLGLVFIGSICFSVVMAACAPEVVSSSTGPRNAGAACAINEQCATGRCSADVSSGGCGVCLDVRKLGETCGGPDQSCNDSAVCVKGACQSNRKVLGDSCSVGGKSGDPCDDELYCDRPLGNQGKCVAPVAVGGSCDPSSSICVKGAYCDESGVCAIPPAGSCALHPCGAGLFCDDHKMCRWATSRRGESCGSVDGKLVDNGCALGTACGNAASSGTGGGPPKNVDTCLPLPGEGEICVRNQCAAGLFCTHPMSNTIGTPPHCEVLREHGDDCNTNGSFHIDCGPGLECRHGACEHACD